VRQIIPFKEGSYLVESALLVTPNQRAVALAETVVEVFNDGLGTRQMQGKALVRNALVVELMEDEEHCDLLLDFGPGFRYRLHQPKVNAGKVFHPATRSTLRFAPDGPLEALNDAEFERQTALLHWVELASSERA